MTRYTYKGYVLLNGGGICRIYHNGNYVRSWPQVNFCKMMINASIREGKTLEEYLIQAEEESKARIARFAEWCNVGANR